ncbi:DUF3467 domain-containing protein [Pararhodobacter sp. SW119]|uniref:DUF3467 domain-containing protein n=1 Tax=Pararhodobacter sp. SW119 TaxID=2780075 RepID=UPI001AE050CE|nr:DUF3467 domain-containing protein [Pararhodobacter sp. SW119]
MSDSEDRLGVDAGKPAAPVVNWDDTQMKTSYANVVNASSTREEVALFFGTNLTWNPGERREFNVRLNDRVVLSPFAAKRLWILLGAILREYESRFGQLGIDAGADTAGAESTQRKPTGQNSGGTAASSPGPTSS